MQKKIEGKRPIDYIVYAKKKNKGQAPYRLENTCKKKI